MGQTVSETGRQIPESGSFDVVVCGGGIAGISAALAAARNGARTLLLEREYILGGLATAGLITIYLPLCDGEGRQVSFGIAEELLRFSVRHGYEGHPRGYGAWVKKDPACDKKKDRFAVQYNPQIFALEAEQLLLSEGVEILYGSLVCGVQKKENRITHLFVESKSGRTAVKAGAVVDCTGDADVVHQAGEQEALFGQGNVLAGWYYGNIDGEYQLCPVGASDIPEEEKTPDHPGVITDRRYGGLEQKELSEQVIHSHRATLNHFFKAGELSPKHTLATVSTIPQVRMTRRINGVYCMDYSEMHKEFEDSLGLYSDWRKRGPVFELPFSVLHGKKIENLICAGRNISVTDSLWDASRVIPVCAVSGEAAGTAAALCENFNRADVALLQKTLQKNGVVLHEKDL